jgi:hypothetical protein
MTARRRRLLPKCGQCHLWCPPQGSAASIRRASVRPANIGLTVPNRVYSLRTESLVEAVGIEHRCFTNCAVQASFGTVRALPPYRRET